MRKISKRTKKTVSKKPYKIRNRLKLACQLVQLHARLRDTDVNGYGKCCSCNRVIAWNEGNGGHYQPKGRHYNGACLMEENVNLQCINCNFNYGGNPAGYTEFMERKYGKKIISTVKKRSYETWDRRDVEDAIQTYRDKCRKLAKTKNLEINIP